MTSGIREEVVGADYPTPAGGRKVSPARPELGVPLAPGRGRSYNAPGLPTAGRLSPRNRLFLWKGWVHAQGHVR
jgi:hypothetical protein